MNSCTNLLLLLNLSLPRAPSPYPLLQVHLGGEETEEVTLIQSSSEKQASSLSSTTTVSVMQKESKEVKEIESKE